MSASSGSYVAGADIIDLDRYMRASVRPSRHGRAYTRERFVVDAGGAHRVPVVASSDSDAPPSAARCKRYSHDSGLSDNTYVKRKHKPRRCTTENKYYESSRNVASNSSVREFRAVCEKALREQQEQIARVTEICERLVQPQMAQHFPKNVTNGPNGINNSPQIVQDMRQSLNHEANINNVENLDCKVNQNSDKQNFGQNVTQKIKRRPATSDSSDVTSSIESWRDIRRKDKHRSESCKTYNLIMGKLDELSHLFATRRLPPAGARASSGSVSVCDKLVATEDVKRINTPVIQVMHSSRVSDRARSEGRCSNKGQLAVMRAPAVDIAPGGRDRVEESLVEHWRESASGAVAGAFDLNDPVLLYAQAKRLQALHASRRRTSTDRSRKFEDKFGDQLDDQSCDKLGDKLDASLCALCRGYCRVVWRYLKQQLFGTCS